MPQNLINSHLYVNNSRFTHIVVLLCCSRVILPCKYVLILSNNYVYPLKARKRFKCKRITLAVCHFSVWRNKLASQSAVELFLLINYAILHFCILCPLLYARERLAAFHFTFGNFFQRVLYRYFRNSRKFFVECCHNHNALQSQFRENYTKPKDDSLE